MNDKYKAKPVIVEAWQFTAEGYNSRPKWIVEAQMTAVLTITLNRTGESYITFKNGTRVKLGDYIIKDNYGHYFECSKETFSSKFEII